MSGVEQEAALTRELADKRDVIVAEITVALSYARAGHAGDPAIG